MRLRRQLISVHKWMGLTIALFLAIQCVTGLALVYRAELHAFLAAPPSRVEQIDLQLPPLSQVVASVSARYPDFAVSRVVYPALKTQPFTIYLDTGHAVQKTVDVSADSRRVDVLSDTIPRVFDVVFRLHHLLLIEGDTGRYFVGTTGLVLIFMLVSGIYIWWPGISRIRRSLAISRYRNPVTFFWQVHRTVGVAGLLLVVMLAITGILLSFGPELRSLLVVEQTNSAPGAGSVRLCDGSVLDAQILSASSQFPDSIVRDVRFDSLSNGVARVLFFNKTKSGLGPPHQVWMRPCEEQIITVKSGDLPLNPEGLLSWMYPIHTGIALGYTGRLLTFLSGLTVFASMTTGVLIWTSRNRLKSAKRKMD